MNAQIGGPLSEAKRRYLPTSRLTGFDPQPSWHPLVLAYRSVVAQTDSAVSLASAIRSSGSLKGLPMNTTPATARKPAPSASGP